MQPFRILHAENDTAQAKLFAKVIRRVLTPMLDVGIEITNVTTLRELLERAHEYDARIVDLHLDDAGEDLIIESIWNLTDPTIVLTGVQDNLIDRRCTDAGAKVFVKAEFDEVELCTALIHSFRYALGAQAA